MSVAIDASALIAFLRQEPGAAVTAKYLRRSCISAVNLAEVLERCSGPRENRAGRLLALLKNWQVQIVSFDAIQAMITAEMKPQLRGARLSFAERATLAVARTVQIPVLTANRELSKLDLGVDVIQIREERA